MVFSSYAFIFGFMPITLFGFWLTSRVDHCLSRIWLCVASIVFYGWWNPIWIPVLLLSIGFNYVIGLLLIRRANLELPTGSLLFLGIGANLLALIYYKYLFAMLAFFGISFSLVPDDLPLGISFFTFTQIAFLIDVSQGFRERYTPVNYLLFVTFFPHLIAGPIVHHRDLMPQFEAPRNQRLHPNDMAIGLAIFSMGLTKKTLIADNLSPIAEGILGAGHVDAYHAWCGALAYSMQLYFDFSGYSDMAIGLARLFGIKFPINFDSPYKATSIIEFWQRWHITLTRFLTSYLYNPIALALVRRRASVGLSTSRRASQTPRGFLELIALPTMVTMLIAGIWHGAGLQFVVFGALHGFYISVNHMWRTFGAKRAGWITRLPAVVRIVWSTLLVYVCVIIAQIFFRAPSVGSAVGVVSEMFFPAPAVAHPELHLLEITLLTGSALLAWFAPNTQQIMANYDPVLDLGRHIKGSWLRVALTPGWAIGIGVVLFAGLISISVGQPFIYFKF